MLNRARFKVRVQRAESEALEDLGHFPGTRPRPRRGRHFAPCRWAPGRDQGAPFPCCLPGPPILLRAGQKEEGVASGRGAG